jgi:hypothetical protein
MSTDIRRLLTEARKLIAAMDPKPGSGLDAVDELVHAALIRTESDEQMQPLVAQFEAAEANAERLLAKYSQQLATVTAEALRASNIELGPRGDV